MRYKVYTTQQLLDGSIDSILHTQTDDAEVARLAVEKVVNRLGPALVVICMERDEIMSVTRGNK